MHNSKDSICENLLPTACCVLPFILLLLSSHFCLLSFKMDCRPDCGACCIAISISSQIPGMPDGKPSGVRCIHLMEDYKCALFGDPSRPKVCSDYQAEHEFCGTNRSEALQILYSLEGKSNYLFPEE